MNLIILHSEDLVDGDVYRLTDDRADHIRQVLKSEAGDELNVGLIDGPKGTGVVESVDDDGVVLRCTWLGEHEVLPVIDLVLALPRPQTLKKVLASAAAMGVRNIHLVNACRVKQRYFMSSLLHYEKYKRFLFEGLSQGRQTKLPKITIHHDFDEFFGETLGELEAGEPKPYTKLIAEPETGRFVNSIALSESDRILLAIGPEGGWVQPELDMFEELGFCAFSLGRWILRVENAVVAALSQIELVIESAGGDE
jgi:RsmE family RNA methyltransferase